MPEALAALWSVLSAFLMLQRVEVLKKRCLLRSVSAVRKTTMCVHRHTRWFR